MSLKIFKTNFKIYYKNTTNLPRYLQIIIIIIVLLIIKVDLKYLNVKNKSALLVLQVAEPLNRVEFLKVLCELVITSTWNGPR